MKQTRQLRELFREREAPPWGVETHVAELLAEAGTLADSIMIKEGRRRIRQGQTIDLEDDLADVLFVLLELADHYGVDIARAYADMLRSTREKLERVQPR